MNKNQTLFIPRTNSQLYKSSSKKKSIAFRPYKVITNYKIFPIARIPNVKCIYNNQDSFIIPTENESELLTQNQI